MSGNVVEVINSTGFLFTLEELERCDTRPKPTLKLKYFENPKNDNEKLFNLQKDFYEARKDNDPAKEKKIYWEMWQLTGKVAKRIIIKILKARGLEFAPDEVNDKVSETCFYLLRRFYSRKNYFIAVNWIVAIRDSIRHALDYQTDLDELTDVIGDFSVINNGSIKSISGRLIDEGEN